MAHSHGHGHAEGPPRNVLRFLLLAALLLIGVGLFLLVASRLFQPGFSLQTNIGVIVRGEVVRVVSEDTQARTQTVDVRITEGSRAGQRTLATQQVVSFEENINRLAAGDPIFVLVDEDNPGTPVFVVDFIRNGWLALLGILLAVATIGIARWQGVGAIVGLGVTFGVLAVYVVPAILSGQNPVITAVVGSILILLVTLYMAHGFNWKATAALLGTAGALLLTGMLSQWSIDLTRLTGLASDEAAFLYAQSGGMINLKGLLLAGMIIGAIGALNDASITQSSAVFELKASEPNASWTRLYNRGMRVGRDHIASSIYTLVLAYAGAALPLFLLVALSTDPLSLTVNREFISEELIRTIVGTMGLLACVPLTTLLAALAAAGGGAGAGPADGEFRALLPGAASAVSARDGSREGPA